MFKGHCRSINWCNFNSDASEGVERPKGRERDGGTAGWWSRWNTHTIHWLNLIWVWFIVPQNNSQHNSNITDHQSKYDTNEKLWNMVIFLICNTKTQHKCCWKMMPTDMFDTGCHNFQFVKKKKKNYMSSAIRLSTVKQGVSTLQNQCCNR